MENRLPEVGEKIIIKETECSCTACLQTIDEECEILSERDSGFEEVTFDVLVLSTGNRAHDVRILDWKPASQMLQQIQKNYNV